MVIPIANTIGENNAKMRGNILKSNDSPMVMTMSPINASIDLVLNFPVELIAR